MARMKSEGIRVTYAGAVILAENDYLANDNVELSRSFTTTAEQLVDAAAPALRDYGNAQGEYALEVVADYPNKALAMQALLERTNFAEANQTGELVLAVGRVESKWRAGLNNVSGVLSVSPGGKMRLTFGYSFTLGAKL